MIGLPFAVSDAVMASIVPHNMPYNPARQRELAIWRVDSLHAFVLQYGPYQPALNLLHEEAYIMTHTTNAIRVIESVQRAPHLR